MADEHNVDQNSQITAEKEIESFLGKIQNKYSGNTDQKHLNQMYDIGILVSNKKHNKQKMAIKLAKLVDERSIDPIKIVSENKRKNLLNALQQGVKDGMSDTYRLAYDGNSQYQYTAESLAMRSHIDKVLDDFRSSK
jgi:hypothetical protein